jgi:DNA polymerase IIIc chi subunit
MLTRHTKVIALKTSAGAIAAQQYMIVEDVSDAVCRLTFQSYNTIIARITVNSRAHTRSVELDKDCWDYSRTTSKYRNQFLGENTKTTRRSIESGEYLMRSLNKQG